VDAVSSGLCPDEEGIAWLNPFVTDIENSEKNVTFGMYYNYADPTLGGGKDAGERYWLENYDRLLGIKKTVDPGLLFLNPQTIGS